MTNLPDRTRMTTGLARATMALAYVRSLQNHLSNLLLPAILTTRFTLRPALRLACRIILEVVVDEHSDLHTYYLNTEAFLTTLSFYSNQLNN